MNRTGLFTHNRALLLPVILTVSFFLVFLGMKAPTVPNPAKPKLRTRAVVEAQQLKVAKTCQTKAYKYFGPMELSRQPEIVRPAALVAPLPTTVYHAPHLPSTAHIPSRGPPVSDLA